jgi:uncharacterized membrane protein YgcG
MKKIFLGLALVFLGSLVTSGNIGAQSALDDFVITNYVIEMNLGRDGEGRSTLRATETITADFQRRNRNRGIERAFVKEYDGHSTDFKLESVTDEQGKKLSYHWNGNTLRIGEEGVYVFGPQTYRITYTQRDVTRHYADTGKDEFYWDAIGTEWRVPIRNAAVQLVLTPEIRKAVQTDLQCYSGVYGRDDRCAAEEKNGTYSITTQHIGEGRGITVALGFTPETFVGYQPSLLERFAVIWGIITAITSTVATGMIVWLAVRAYRWTYRNAELGTIVPEYIPPRDASVATSAAVTPGVYSTTAAELTDLAVRHYIQIFETREKTLLKAAEYDIEIVKDVSNLREEEREILKDMFGHEPKVGERLALKKLQNSTAVYTRFSDNDKKLKDLLRGQYGLKRIDNEKRGWFSKAAKTLFVTAALTLSPLLFIAGIVAFIMSKTVWVLSDKGLALRRYIKGLELYIKVAEKDRLKMLQSPEGAEKVAVSDPTNPAQLVKLYERVLPYAVLLGQEKEWSKRLGDYYAQTNTAPTWYSGNAAFNAVAFSSMMSSFTASASASSASSSSGGSSGGGFSGGGGGGGGGGGW